MNLYCVLNVQNCREKKSQNLSGSLSDIIFVLPLTYCYATHDLNENFISTKIFKKRIIWLHGYISWQYNPANVALVIYIKIFKQSECCFFCNVSIKKDPMIHYAICSDTLPTLMMLNCHVFDFTVHAWETPICLQCKSFWHSHLMGNQHFSLSPEGVGNRLCKVDNVTLLLIYSTLSEHQCCTYGYSQCKTLKTEV